MAVDEAVSDYILNILREQIGMDIPFDPARIRNVVRAELTPGPYCADGRGQTRVIEDPATLGKLEALLAYAETSYPSKCPFGQCLLILDMVDGSRIELALAADSCTQFYRDGCYFDYMPREYRNSDNHPVNGVLFDLFGVSAEEFCG